MTLRRESPLKNQLRRVNQQEVASQFTQCHIEKYQPTVGTHHAQYDGKSLAQSGKKTEKGHPGTTPTDIPLGTGQLLGLDMKETLYPSHIAQQTYPIAGHAAQRVPQCAKQQQGPWGQTYLDEAKHDQFGTERHNGTGQECSNEHARIAILQQNLYQCIHKQLYTDNPIKHHNTTRKEMLLARVKEVENR